MKKFIPIILITFLWIGNLAYAGISDEDRKKFDDGLARIEAQKSNYKRDKQAQRQRERPVDRLWLRRSPADALHA